MPANEKAPHLRGLFYLLLPLPFRGEREWRNLGSVLRVARLVLKRGGADMPRGDKSRYSDKQKRKAEHIADGYEDRGVPEGEAERRAWARTRR